VVTEINKGGQRSKPDGAKLMAERQKRKIAAFQHYYAQSGHGRQHQTKRKLSGDKEESIEKRDKKLVEITDKLPSTSSSPEGNKTETTETIMATDSTNKVDLARAMKKVMMDDDFSELLVIKFKAICDDRIDEKAEEIKLELKEVKEEQNKQKEGLENVQRKIDELEQDKRLNNLLVRGVPLDGRNTKQACMAKLNKEMKIHLKTADITYVIPIGKSEDGLVKMAFSDGKKREEVYKSRAKLKGKDIWITEDLTPRKSSLFYKTRQAVKEGLGVLTWTHNGKIFMKATENAKPKLVNCEDDLPKPRPSASTQNTAETSD
jgi:hypothetical protein